MSSQLTLLDMPDDEMRKILDHCNFNSILTLRKVCHDLRNFIDDVKPDKKLTEIFIKLDSNSINLSIQNQMEFGTYHIKYQFYNGNCIILTRGTAHFFKPENDKRKKLKGQNHVDIFVKDLEIILKFQKMSVLDKFFMSFDVEDTIGLMGKLENFFKNRSPIKVEDWGFRSYFQRELLQVLPYFDTECLYQIFIAYQGPQGLSEELVALEQWKKAKSLAIFDFTKEKMDSCLNFEEVIANCGTIPVDDVMVIKEKFLQSTTLKTFRIHYANLDARLYEVLGQNSHLVAENIYRPESSTKEWFYSTSEVDKMCCLHVCSHFLKLSYIDREVVPRFIEIQ